jgi:hypothetical protein
MKPYSLESKVQHQTNVFVSDLLGGVYSVSSGITNLVIEGLSFGYYNPDGATDHILGVTFQSQEEIEEYARERFFEVLTGKMTIGKFCEETFTIAAVFRRETRKKEDAK